MALSPVPFSRRALAAVALGSLAVSTLTMAPSAQANPAGTGLVISEAYGGGGNSSATWRNDFVEIYNPTAAAIGVDGLSVEYLSAAGNSGGTAALDGKITPGAHYLVQLASGGANGTLLPTPDATGTMNMSASNGTVRLMDGATTVDLVGYGTATVFEGTAATGALSSTKSASRTPSPGADTDDNAADFTTAAAITPEACGTGCEGGIEPPPPPTPEEHSIAEIQGTGDTSPYAGSSVITRGVVTAAYPTGGFNGFYLQTAGSGGDTDATPGASDGIFIYGSAATAKVARGDYVQVTGQVSEFRGTTEITPAAADVVVLDGSGVAAPTPTSSQWPRTDAAREAFEGMLLAPAGDFTVTDNYSLNQYGEIAIAQGTEPLPQRTDVARPGSPEADAVVADNDARRVTLDDGATTNFLYTDAGEDTPLPWLTDDPTIRVGEPVSFVAPVIVEFRNSRWNLQPVAQLTAGDANGVLPATFGDTRTAHPADVGGDLQVASFNVLNYFTDLGVDQPGCSFYYDRTEADPVTVSGGCDVRGAAEQEDLDRQQAKIVKAINATGAEVVSLEEVENSARLGHDRDATLAHLVDALNADAGAGTWAYVPTPSTAGDQADEDVIRTAFIYQPAAVQPVGESVIDDVAAFAKARDPLAQVFSPVDGQPGDEFVLIVNHFKSKGSPPKATDADYEGNFDTGDGQGNWNSLRVTQAHELVRFAEQMTTDTGVQKVFLDGDFNSYTQEDPMQVLYDAGYTDLDTHFDGGQTYLFDGVVGSLDHSLANQAALGATTGSAVWNINSVESVALEYSRYNYNATNFYTVSPYRSSDHDPIVFGFDVSEAPTASLSARAVPDPVTKKERPTVVATVESSDGSTVQDGTVTVSFDGEVLGSAPVTDGRAQITLPVFKKRGDYVVDVTYDGARLGTAATTVVIHVVKKA